MTQRSILTGTNPILVIKAGMNVSVQGCDGDTARAISNDVWGVKIEKKSEAEFARARAAVGDTVLFDIRMKRPNLGGKREDVEVIEIQLGGSGEVMVPYGSTVKVYAGMNLEVRGIRGQVDAYAGFNLTVQDAASVGNASAGWKMDLDCQTLAESVAELSAGRDLRLHVQDLTNATLRVKDIGGYWEGQIGAGERKITLKSGGDVTLVTDQTVEALPPNYILGNIEKPTSA